MDEEEVTVYDIWEKMEVERALDEVTIDFPEMTADEAEYFMHNEHGLCGCFNCDTFRERTR